MVAKEEGQGGTSVASQEVLTSKEGANKILKAIKLAGECRWNVFCLI